MRFLVCFLLLQAASAFFGSTCRSEYSALNSCYDEDSSCDHCEIIGPLSNLFAVGFCDTANDSLCNGFNCCQSCETEFEAYETCMANLISRLTMQSCQIDCEVAPTSAPTSIAEAEAAMGEELERNGCLEKFGAFATCAVRNPLECATCALTNLPGNPLETSFCIEAENSICGFGNCCEPCEAEFTEFDDCFEDVVANITNGGCLIDCDNFEETPGGGLDMTCLDRFTNYTDCVSQNLPACGACAILNFPDIDDGLCEASTNAICGFADCCEECNAEFQKFDECFEDWVQVATLNQCQIDCDTWDGSTVSGSGNCVDKAQAYADCVTDHPFRCGLCVIPNLPDLDDGNYCAAAKDSICGFGDCCSACSREFDEFDDCVESLASTVTLGQCKIDCDAVDRDSFWGGRALRGNEDSV